MSIFDYEPRKVPVPRYPQFITAFEHEVDEAQKRIKLLEKMERPYSVVTAALEEVDLPNQIIVKMRPTQIKIDAVALETDSTGTFKPMIDNIGAKLFAADLHSDGEPSVCAGGWWRCLEYGWSRVDKNEKGFPFVALSVNLQIDLPLKGLIDLEVKQVERVSTDYRYEIIPRKGAALPKAIRDATRYPGQVDDEIIF